MDSTTTLNHILNGQTSEQFIALLFWGLIGFVCSILIELLRHTKKIKTKGGFDFVFWLKDNSIRFVLSLLAIVIGALFSKELIGKDIGNWGALLTGLVTDKIIEALTKFKSIINVYGTKSDN